MTDPKPDTKKEEQHSSKQGSEPAKTVLPEGMMYPTPELNPETGAPIDPRFQGSANQEATASKPSPKSGEQPAPKPAPKVAEGKIDKDEDDDDNEAKGKDKPRSRR
jgi:hypothetical protein